VKNVRGERPFRTLVRTVVVVARRGPDEDVAIVFEEFRVEGRVTVELGLRQVHSIGFGVHD